MLETTRRDLRMLSRHLNERMNWFCIHTCIHKFNMYSEVRLLIFLLPRWLLYINDRMSLTNPSIPMIDVGTPNGITNAPQQNWWFFTRSVVTTIYSLKLLSSMSVKYKPEYINFVPWPRHGNVNTTSYGGVKIYHNKSSHYFVSII